MAGVAGLLAAVLALFLHQPGRPRLREIEPNPEPTSRDMT